MKITTRLFIKRETGNRSAFTLIELLVVIAIIAVLAVVVVLTLNPAELLRQSRDSNRVSDLDTLTHAISLYQTDQGGSSGYSMGNASSVYVSIPDATLSGNQTSTCTSLGLPTPPTGYSYQCSSPQSYRNIDGTGWIPIDFASTTTGSPLGSLPIDPVNTSSTGLYYTYATNGNQYEVTSLFESQKYKAQYAQNPIDPMYPEVNAKGSSLSVSPLYNPSGLIGYWPLDEGSGTVAYDQSGNGNNGAWQGTQASPNSTYYGAGKVGSYAGDFDGATDYVATTPISSTGSQFTLTAWIHPNGTQGSMTTIISVRDCSLTYLGLNYGSDGTQLGYSWYPQGVNSYNWNSGIVIPNNQWSLVAVSIGNNSTMVFLGNGGTLSSATNNIPSLAGAFDLPNNIGRDPCFNRYFNGSINDVRIYNRTLSYAEVQALYNAQN